MILAGGNRVGRLGDVINPRLKSNKKYIFSDLWICIMHTINVTNAKVRSVLFHFLKLFLSKQLIDQITLTQILSHMAL